MNETGRDRDGLAPCGSAASGKTSATPLCRILRVLGVAAALPLLLASAQADVECTTLELPGNEREDGTWSALYAGRDGTVYIGAQAHGGETNFYRYDPKTKRIRLIADMMEAAGERGRGIRGQAKIHTKFVEDRDGVIYFGTGNCGSGPWNIDPRSWGGAYWWAYDPRTDKLENLGPVGDGFTDLYGLAYDRVRHRLYATAWNGHLYIFDIAARVTTDAGRVSNWDTCRTLVADDEGNCYGTSDKFQMFKYDAKAGRLLDIPVLVLHDPYQWPQNYGRPRLDRKNIWRVAEFSEMDKQVYLIEGGSTYLSRYNPKAGPYGSIEFLAEMAVPTLRGSHDLPYACLSMTLGTNNWVYYAPGGSVFDYGFDSEDGGANGEIRSFLVSYDPATRQRVDYGRLVEKGSGRRILGTQAAATAPDGTLYFFGAVEETDPKKALPEKVLGKAPFICKVIIVDPRSLTPVKQP